jgi:hypothetical protein
MTEERKMFQMAYTVLVEGLIEFLMMKRIHIQVKEDKDIENMMLITMVHQSTIQMILNLSQNTEEDLTLNT